MYVYINYVLCMGRGICYDVSVNALDKSINLGLIILINRVVVDPLIL